MLTGYVVCVQESRIVRVMRKQLVKRSLDMIKDISKRPAGDSGRGDYDTFWEVGGFATLRGKSDQRC